MEGIWARYAMRSPFTRRKKKVQRGRSACPTAVPIWVIESLPSSESLNADSYIVCKHCCIQRLQEEPNPLHVKCLNPMARYQFPFNFHLISL